MAGSPVAPPTQLQVLEDFLRGESAIVVVVGCITVPRSKRCPAKGVRDVERDAVVVALHLGPLRPHEEAHTLDDLGDVVANAHRIDDGRWFPNQSAGQIASVPMQRDCNFAFSPELVEPHFPPQGFNGGS